MNIDNAFPLNYRLFLKMFLKLELKDNKLRVDFSPLLTKIILLITLEI